MSISRDTYYGGSAYRATGTTVALTAQDKRVQVVAPSTQIAVLLPSALVLQTGWVQFVIINTSNTHNILVGDVTGTTLLGIVGPEQAGEFALLSKPNLTGVWLATIAAVNSTPPPPPPAYGAWGSVQGTGISTSGSVEQAAVVLYDFVTDTSRTTLDPVAGGDKRFGQSWSAEGDAHWVMDKATGTFGNNTHRTYTDVDVFAAKSMPSAWLDAGAAPITNQRRAGEGIGGNGVGWSGKNSPNPPDCQEWDPTDTWTVLAALPVLSGAASGNGYPGLAHGSTARDLQALVVSTSALPNGSPGGESGNRQTLFDRPTQVYTVAPRNPLADQHFSSDLFATLDGDNSHNVSGDHNDDGSSLTDTGHYAYDLSLGVLGAWSVKASWVQAVSLGNTSERPTMQSTSDPTKAVRQKYAGSTGSYTTDMVFYSTTSDTWTTLSTHTGWRCLSYKGTPVQKA